MPEQRKRNHVPHHWGGAKPNLIVILMCIGIGLTMLFLSLSRARGQNRRLRDASQIVGIHQSWLVFSREFGTEMPTPGLFNRLPFNGVEDPGRGEEDVSQNTTANLHSLCVMQNYYSPELCVGPSEPSAVVKVFPQDDYNFAMYSPASNQAWDPAFTADLQTGSNVSYASMPLAAQLRAKHWRETLDSAWPIIGNRGPRDGLHDADSITLQIHPPRDQWSGNICFIDNHMGFFKGLSSTRVDPAHPFNTQGVFRYDGEHDADGILSFTKAMTPEGPVLQHD